MRQLVESGDTICFCGSVGNRDDLRAAAKIAGECHGYAIDEDDEDYCDGARTCFNCRYRRWCADGFMCAKGCL